MTGLSNLKKDSSDFSVSYLQRFFLAPTKSFLSSFLAKRRGCMLFAMSFFVILKDIAVMAIGESIYGYRHYICRRE